jgi:isopentenyl diphosphate isomerase/L-lactate dehydrogenase-like FMN-dependent dehydrogenase
MPAPNRFDTRRRLLRFLAESPLLYAGVSSAVPLGWAAAQELSGQGVMIDTLDEALNVFDLEVAMKSRINAGHWAYMAQGSDDSGTIAANRAAFAKIQLRPQRLVDTRTVDISVELFGERYDAPIFLCPVGAQGAFHHEGELAVARAAKSKNALQILSTVTNFSVEDVAEARGAPIWFQLYPAGDWDVTKRIVKRAENAGCKALAFTVDLPARNLEPIARYRRDQNEFCMACHTPGYEASMRTKPMFDGVDLSTMGGMGIGGLTWDYVSRLKDATSMRVLVKGIVTGEDAERCVERGADGVIVSNHGGRADETLRGSIESLPEVLAAVGGRVPVIVDSGFRRGTDIFKALALGATAVGVGRPYLWGLGAFGQPGVERVLDILERELLIVMRQMGAASLANISPSSLIRSQR